MAHSLYYQGKEVLAAQEIEHEDRKRDCDRTGKRKW